MIKPPALWTHHLALLFFMSSEIFFHTVTLVVIVFSRGSWPDDRIVIEETIKRQIRFWIWACVLNWAQSGLQTADCSAAVVQTAIRASDRVGCCCWCSVRADPAKRSVGQTGSHLSRAKFPDSFLLQLQDCLCSFVSQETMMILGLNWILEAEPGPVM